MRVVVVGATGNVGTSVLRSLEMEERVESVLGLARRLPGLRMGKVEWARADIASDDLAPHFRGADAVVLLAWLIQPSRDLNKLWMVNVEGSMRAARAVAEAGGGFVFATGHPGALLAYYLGLARWVEDLGGRALTARTRGLYKKRGVPLDWVGAVGTLSNGASLLHTHSPAPMRDLLRELGAVDLVVADHGFAGAAIASGIPTVSVMDTNDPALAVAAHRGADLTVVPMDDNRPQNSYTVALGVLKGER